MVTPRLDEIWLVALYRTGGYPTQVPINFQGQRGQIVLDQTRSVDHEHLVRRLDRAPKAAALAAAGVLVEMFTRTGIEHPAAGLQ